MSTDYFDLGAYSRPVTTSSPESRLWFDRGLIWTYAFNHEEAVHCFRRALQADPDCALAHWGPGLRAGPNYNKPWDFFDAEELATTVVTAHEAARRALALADAATSVERALAEALCARYPRPAAEGDQTGWNRDYADAMRTVQQRYGRAA